MKYVHVLFVWAKVHGRGTRFVRPYATPVTYAARLKKATFHEHTIPRHDAVFFSSENHCIMLFCMYNTIFTDITPRILSIILSDHYLVYFTSPFGFFLFFLIYYIQNVSYHMATAQRSSSVKSYLCLSIAVTYTHMYRKIKTTQ